MTTIALFGTSADPPTLGHQALLEGLLDHHDRVVTWASDNPGKCHGLPLQQRQRLLRTLVTSLADPRLSVEQGLSSPFAIRTLRQAAALWPDATLSFVIGGDLVEQIVHWKDADQLLQGCRITVVPREGWSLSENGLESLRQAGADLEVLRLKIPGTASSQVRRNVDTSQIPVVLHPLLVENGFYGFSKDSQPASP